MVRENESECEINRREFMQLALLSSAMLLNSGTAFGAEDSSSPSSAASFAVLSELPPGVVRPEGWLRIYLERQASELGSQLPQVSWPFSAPYWAGEESAESWWPWEQKAYWIDGATRLALVLDNQQLMEQVNVSIRYTMEHIGSRSYLGPSFFQDPKGDYHRWPHTVFWRALLAGAGAGHNPGAAEMIRKFYLGDQATYGTPIRNVTNVEVILWCYAHTGDKRLLELAENAWQEFLTTTTEGGDHGDLAPLRVFAATPIDGHGVTYSEEAKLPAILFMYTGKSEYLQYALAAQRRIFDHHMLIDGVPSTSEYFRTRTALDSHETCDITDHTWTWGYMMMATGEAIWADRIERACFNAGFGAIKKDWKALQYFSCPNQFLATLNSDHNVMRHGGFMMAFQPNPGKATACCGGNVHRLYPNYVIRMWMKSRDGGLAAVLYGPSRVQAKVGAEEQEIEIVQETNYPFEDQIDFIIHADRAVHFPLSLRIPSWCDQPEIRVNGKSTALPEIRDGFISLDRRFNPGDRITLQLPMKAAISYWPQNGVGVEHGPLVYSLAIKENWTPVVESKFTTSEFPSWNAMPTSAWNYGLAIDPQHIHEEVHVRRRTMNKDPWVDPPVTLTVPARQVEGWKLQPNPSDSAQQFTPPLPEVADSKVANQIVRLTLVPYGSTHLRVTIFPDVHNTSQQKGT
jgi:hypothetical protein